jgi:hypothetical protein
MSTHRIKLELIQDGKLELENIPFHAGDKVEVTISATADKPNGENPYPLRGTPVIYKLPTDPVGLEDWDALQ